MRALARAPRSECEKLLCPAPTLRRAIKTLPAFRAISASAWRKPGPSGAWGATGAHAVLELEQLALERFLIGGREASDL